MSKKMNKVMKKDIKKAERRERQRKAIELRKAGFTYQQIGDQLQCNQSTAHRLVKTAMDETIKDDADELREMQGARYSTMLMTTWPGVQGGDGASIDRALRIMDRQNALHGLNAPKEFTINGRTQHELVIGGDTDSFRDALRQYRAQGQELEALGAGASPQHVDSGEVIEAEIIEDSDDA